MLRGAVDAAAARRNRVDIDGGLRAGTLVELPGYAAQQGITWWVSRVAGEPRSLYVAQFFDWLAAQGAPDLANHAGTLHEI